MTYFQRRHAADEFQDGTLRRLLRVNGKLVLAAARSAGGIAAPRIAIRLTPAPGLALTDGDVAEARRQIRHTLGADDDIAPFYDMARADARLAPLADAMRGLRPMRTPTAYEALTLAIMGQQISTSVALTLRSLFIETYGERAVICGAARFAFPQPDAVAAAGPDGLRAIKFSGRKAEYVADISALAASGEFSPDDVAGLPQDEAADRLARLRGVGPWTAQWTLMRGLGYGDCFPYGDLALQRMMGALVGGGQRMSGEAALAYSERWSPYRSYVTAYMFGAARAGRFDAIVAAAG